MKSTLGNLDKGNNEKILKKIFIKFGEFMNKIFKNQKLDEILDLKSDVTNKSKKKKKSKRKQTLDEYPSTVSVFDFHKPNTTLSSSPTNTANSAISYNPTTNKQYLGKDDYIEIIEIEDEETVDTHDLDQNHPFVQHSNFVNGCNQRNYRYDSDDTTTQEDSGNLCEVGLKNKFDYNYIHSNPTNILKTMGIIPFAQSKILDSFNFGSCGNGAMNTLDSFLNNSKINNIPFN